MLLELKSVSCGYGSVPIFQNISFAVNRGETLCLLGPNGVGKTTLFKTILGLLSPLAGDIFLSGENMSGWTAEERAQRIAYVPQVHTPPLPLHRSRCRTDGAGCPHRQSRHSWEKGSTNCRRCDRNAWHRTSFAKDLYEDQRWRTPTRPLGTCHCTAAAAPVYGRTHGEP